MSFITRAFSRRNETRNNPVENPAVSLAAGWQFLMGGQHGSDAGEVINERTSLEDATVWACVRIIAESVSNLPLRLLKLSDSGRSVATNHPLYLLLARNPNPESTSVTFFEQHVLSLALTGNAYAQIQRSTDGRPVALWPLLPHQVTPLRDMQGNLVYKINVALEGMPADYRVLDKRDVLHTKLFGLNGLTGMSPIEMQRQTIGLSRGATRNAARLFGNGSVPTMVLVKKSPLPLAPEDKTKAREDWETLTSGRSSHRLGILDANWGIEKLGYSQEESQWLESRGFSVEQICGIWRVPPHMVGAQTGRTTNSNMQEQNSLFVSETLKGYLTKIEQEFLTKLLSDAEKTQYELEFDTSSLLLGNLSDQAEYYSTAINGGWLTPAEVRHELGLNPAASDAGLNVYRTPVNYMNSSVLLTQGSDSDAGDVDSDIVTGSTERSIPGVPSVPAANERAALRNYGAAYLSRFTAAIRAVANKESNLAQAFAPLLDSIAEQIAQSVGAEVDKQRMVDYVTKLEQRSAKWTADKIEHFASDELRRAVKAFVFACYEAKAKTVVQGLAS